MLPAMLPTEPVTPESAERDPRAPDVLRLLLDNHARFLSFLERRVGSRDEAEDILQEAFVRSIGRTESLRSAESATAWFYRVLRNALIDHHRREGTRAGRSFSLLRRPRKELSRLTRSLRPWPAPASRRSWAPSSLSTVRRFAVLIWTA